MAAGWMKRFQKMVQAESKAGLQPAWVKEVAKNQERARSNYTMFATRIGADNQSVLGIGKGANEGFSMGNTLEEAFFMGKTRADRGSFSMNADRSFKEKGPIRMGDSAKDKRLNSLLKTRETRRNSGFEAFEDRVTRARAAPSSSSTGPKPGKSKGTKSRSVLGTAYQGANALSKAWLGASIPQMGIAAGVGYAGLSMLGVNVPGAAGTAVGTVQGFQDNMQRARNNSLRDYQDSVSGLTFGLHSRRTA